MRFADDWQMETPMRIHGRNEFGSWLDNGGGPAFSAEFSRWIAESEEDHGRSSDRGPYHNSPARLRVTRAFRRLRQRAPREYDVMHALCVRNPVRRAADLPAALERVARDLTQRAIRLGKPERYTAEGVLILAISACGKLERW